MYCYIGVFAVVWVVLIVRKSIRDVSYPCTLFLYTIKLQWGIFNQTGREGGGGKGASKLTMCPP